MKVLVTGSNGFLGTYLLQELSVYDNDIWGIDRISQSKKTISADILDGNSLSGVLK